MHLSWGSARGSWGGVFPVTPRQRGWLLPPSALCFALGVLLGRCARSPWLGAFALALGSAAVFLLLGWQRFGALLVCFLALGNLRGFQSFHPSLPHTGAYTVTGVISEDIQAQPNGQFRSALSDVTLDGSALPGGRAYWSFYSDTLPDGLAPGTCVTFQGQVYHPSGPSNPDGYNFREELLRRGIRVGIYGIGGLAFP